MLHLAAPLLALAPLQAPAADLDPARLVVVDREALLEAGRSGDAELLGRLDVAAVTPDRTGYELVVHAAELAILEVLGIEYEVLQQDLSAFYASRLHVPAAGPEALEGTSSQLGTWLSPPFAQGSMGGYYTFEEIVSVLDQIAAAYPAIVAPKVSIGTSIQGRNLWALQITDNPGVDEGEREFRLDSMHHCREPMSMQTPLWFVLWLVENYGSDPLATYLVDEREIWWVAVVNPDGYVYNQSIAPGGGGMWRKNRRDNGDGTFGVDLNRNYTFAWGWDDLGSSPITSSTTYRGTAPASEPEIQAMEAFMAAHEFGTALSCHSYANIWIHPWGYVFELPVNLDDYTEVSSLATEFNGYEYGPGSDVLYLSNGATKDHDEAVHGTLSWTVEIGSSADGFWPPTSRIVPLASDNLEAFQRSALCAGPWVRPTSIAVDEAGDGDGAIEPGEAVELRVHLRNSGVAASLTSAVLRLSATGPASVTAGELDLGSLAAFSSADNDAQPLALAVDGGAAPGSPIRWTLEIEFEGWVQTVEGVLLVGQPSPLIDDLVELDVGWIAHGPADSATSGQWEHGSPVGTSYNGAPLAPGSDASPDPASLAFVTGNGGGAPGDDDVDGGTTTLTTPRLDLSGLGSVWLEYARWWADLGDPQDDQLVVELSNDDGASWTTLETVGPTESEWVRKGFLVSDFLPQTATMRLRFRTADDPNNSLVEAGVDDLRVVIYDGLPRLAVWGSGDKGTTLSLNVTGQPGDGFLHLMGFVPAQFTFPQVNGDFLMDPATTFPTFSGVIPAARHAESLLAIPEDPTLTGIVVYFQTFVAGPGGWFFTNRDQFTID